MAVLLVMSAAVGIAASFFTGFEILGWIAGVFVFFCGLPGALIASFVHGEVLYAQDRADYRQTASDLSADIRAEEHEYAEDDRSDRLTEAVKNSPARIYNDNRQVHLHTHRRPR